MYGFIGIMSYSLNSLEGIIKGIMSGNITGAIKEDVLNIHLSTCMPLNQPFMPPISNHMPLYGYASPRARQTV